MWPLLTLATAHLTPFNPILYKRLVDYTGAVVTVWAVKGWASPLLALLVARLRVGTPTREKWVIQRTSLAKLLLLTLVVNALQLMLLTAVARLYSRLPASFVMVVDAIRIVL